MAEYQDFSAEQFVRVSDIAKEPQKMLLPIAGYEDMPLVSLEEAVKPLVPILPRIQSYVYVAKQRCELVPADGLTKDESSSIMLYTMGWEPTEKCLYFALNAALRSEDRRKLRPWFSYLKLMLTALFRLPSTRHFIYRGVKMNLSEQYPTGKTFIWWAFSSCTSSVETLENPEYLGKTGLRTLFTIGCNSGKDISRHSFYQSEKEILLLAARQFIVKACFQQSPDLHMIQLEEVEAPICLLEPVVIDSKSNKSSSSKKAVEAPIYLSQPVVINSNSNKSLSSRKAVEAPICLLQPAVIDFNSNKSSSSKKGSSLEKLFS